MSPDQLDDTAALIEVTRLDTGINNPESALRLSGNNIATLDFIVLVNNINISIAARITHDRLHVYKDPIRTQAFICCIGYTTDDALYLKIGRAHV